MRVVYADPPYPGMGHFYDGREVNHRLLIRYLCDDFDGWALSTASTTLQEVLRLCPTGVRIAAWCKSFASFKPGVSPAYTWEPVIFVPVDRPHDRGEPTVQDHLIEPITLRRGFTGAKPTRFARWIRCLLRATPDDELVDLFPGSGAVSRAWAQSVLV